MTPLDWQQTLRLLRDSGFLILSADQATETITVRPIAAR